MKEQTGGEKIQLKKTKRYRHLAKRTERKKKIARKQRFE